MLIELQIEDFAVVKTLELEFNQGMSVITGETGAGKSILLDALQLALGGRADTSWIRPGCEKAQIAATFDIQHIPCAVLWLTDSELLDEQAQRFCLIRRVLYKNGRSKAFINGKPATTSQLKLLGEYLVQIHGQHQHQLLLKAPEQRRLLDAYAKHDALLSQVKTAFEQLEAIQHQIEQLKAKASLDPARVQLLQYQVEELEKLGLQPGYWQALSQEQKQLANAQNDVESLSQALSHLSSDDINTLDLITKAQVELDNFEDKPSIQNGLELLKTASIQIDEAVSDLQQVLSVREVNPEKLQQLENRSSNLYTVARKHKVEVEQLPELFAQLQTEYQLLQGADDKIQALEEDAQKAQAFYNKVAKKLSQSRGLAANKMAKDIEKWLTPLGIKGGQFAIALAKQSTPQAFGLESVHFEVSTNPGHPLSPLAKIVSGGELSRISLAIQLIAAQYQSTATLIFDEVDVGVGGKIGAIIGQALNQLSSSIQVLCITHLPQVAAFGDNHFLVSKSHAKSSTTTQITPLSDKERIEEVARMLGGIDISKQARANAKALLCRQKEESSA